VVEVTLEKSPETLLPTANSMGGASPWHWYQLQVLVTCSFRPEECLWYSSEQERLAVGP
jgi:hypothetical protein